MTRRTYEADAEHIETADDLDDLVHDKREGWRANSSKARRRQRRYKKRLTNELLRIDYSMMIIQILLKDKNLAAR